jgi:NAD-dependent dihydropyrimidine dehydrogenase PreA subunit
MKAMQYFKNVVTLKLNENLCTGCGMCTVVCPHAVFLIDKDRRKAYIVAIDDCMECGACALNCKINAISVKSGVGCAAGIINSLIRSSESNCECSTSKNNCC